MDDYLGGMAKDWHDEMRPRLIEMPFQDSGEALIRRFRKRTDKQVMTEICNARKKPEDTHEQFANRLKRIASLGRHRRRHTIGASPSGSKDRATPCAAKEPSKR